MTTPILQLAHDAIEEDAKATKARTVLANGFTALRFNDESELREILLAKEVVRLTEECERLRKRLESDDEC